MAHFILPFLFLMIFVSMATSANNSSPQSIFILAGQSNMAGRGGVTCDKLCQTHCKWDGRIPQESTSKPYILRFTAGSNWEEAELKTNGVGPGMAFANQVFAKANDKVGVIGLVPCAIGGSQLKEWIKGSMRYTTLIQRINASLEFGGNARGFLWFQGESDAASKVESQVYHKNLITFFKDIREDLKQPNLPILLVKIGNHDIYISPFINYLDDVRKAEEAVEKELLEVVTVDAKEAIQHVMNDLGQPPYNEDGHLSVYTEVNIGVKLAEAYLKLV